MKNQTPTWKYLLFLLAILVSIIYALPNLYGEDPVVQVSLQDKIQQNNVLEKISKNLNSAKIKYVAENSDLQITLKFQDTDQQLTARDILAEKLSNEKVTLTLSLLPRTPQWLRMLGATPMKLGLDLRGGVHFLLDVDTNSLIKARVNGDVKNITKELREQKIRYLKITQQDEGTIKVIFKEDSDNRQGIKTIKKILDHYNITINKNSIIAKISENQVSQIADYAIEKTITTLNNRVNELGVSEAVVQRQGNNNISVDLPGIQDTARAKEILGKTATLRFHLVNDDDDAANAITNGAPIGHKIYNYANSAILLKNSVVLEGSSITYAQAVMQESQPAVYIKLGGGGESLFHSITAKNIGKRLAVVYVETEVKKQFNNGVWSSKRIPHEKIISAAVIRSALGNSFEVSGVGSFEEAENLALLLRSGSLAAPVDIVQETTVGPSLGKANIDKGINSVIIGSLLVIIFMLAYYRLFGLVANLAVILNIILIIAVLSIIGATLTLPGIAGIVLTVGMAVDANVLINERIREELRNGMPAKMCIDAGYDKAFTTIVDANVTTLIVAMILFSLGSGTVKGFAITLSIGIIASMITAIFFTRAIINYIYRNHSNINKLSIGI